MVKVKENKSLPWRPLSMKSRVLSQNLDLEGLIGVEELTDYTIDKVNNTVLIGAPKIKGKKLKLQKNWKENKEVKDDTKEEKDDCDDNEIDRVPMKKKLKRKRQSEKHYIENIENSDNDDIKAKRKKKNESESSKASSDKKKKKKRKQKLKGNEQKSKIETTTNEAPQEDVDINEDMFLEMSEWTKFNISDLIIKALYEKGFKSPTKIQSLVLPSALLARKNVVGAAETGSGKTLAFGIPILNGILNKIESVKDEGESDEEEGEEDGLEENEENGKINEIVITRENKFVKHKRNKLYALILAPTRELAIQVQNHIKDAGKYMPVKIACVVGGMSTEKQLRVLNKCPHILVATPGRLWEFIQLGHFHLTALNKLNYLVIDETDRMIESGHFPELKNILDRITMTESSEPRQTFVFSATLTHSMKNTLKAKKKQEKKGTKDPSIKKLQDLLKMSNPKIVDITEKIGITKTLTESKIFCKHDQKDGYLYYFMLQHPGRTLVFLNSISSVKRLTQLLTLLKCSPLPLHASMNQRQRLKNLDKFRTNANSILLATDVAARGLDIPGIEHVIHYHVPRTSEIYIHRSGRTARANNEGLTLVLVESDEIHLYIKMFNSLEKKIDLPDFPVDQSFLNMVNKRIELARSIEFLESKVKKNRPDNWIEKAAQDMDIILDDENLVQSKENSRQTALMNRALQAKRNELQKLLGKNVQRVSNVIDVKSALNAVKHAVEDEKEEKKMALKKRNKFKRKFKKRNKNTSQKNS